MPPHPAQLSIDTLLKDCESRRLRRSGPGGQHRNKVETAVQLTHTPTGVVAEANEERSQERNRLMAVHRLRVRLAIEHRSSWTAEDTAPGLTELWQQRTKGGKLAVNPLHADYPALLAEAMDHIASHGYDDRLAAEHLGISRTQLMRFLRIEARSLTEINNQRAERNLGPLR